MKPTAALLPAVAALASANPLQLSEGSLLEARQGGNCPKVHVFGARETTVPQGYGTSKGLVDMVLQANPGATSEAIVYPACGGQSNCGKGTLPAASTA